MNKKIAKPYKIPLGCLRVVFVYIVLLLIAKHTPIFRTGFVPKDIVTIFVLASLMFYLFLTMAVVPAMLTFWLVKTSLDKNKTDT